MLPILQSRRREAIELLALQQLHCGRVLDLNTRVGKQRITDLSPYGNNATLKSGVYFSTDGLADKGIGADCSAEGSGDYYYTARIRSSSAGTKWATIGGAAVYTFLLTSNVWTDATFSTASSVTPSACFVGWSGGSIFDECDWSEVKLWKVGVSNPVAYWPGCDSEAASLDGHLVADISGNGYHGAHVGGSSGSGETDILQTAGLNWNKRLWFDGTDDYVDSGIAFSPSSNDWSITFKMVVMGTPASQYNIIDARDGNNDGIFLRLTTGNLLQLEQDTSGSGLVSVDLSSKYLQLITVVMQRVGNTLSLDVDEGDLTASTTYAGTTSTTNSLKIGRHAISSSSYFRGLIHDVIGIIDGVTQFSYQGYGNLNQHWVDQAGSNDGAVNGSPEQHLIPQLASDPSLDATGQPIVNPRPSGKIVNLASSNLSAQVAADASMDATQTVYGWVYYDGTDGDFLDLGTPFVLSNSGVLLAFSMVGSLTYYVNGVATSTLGSAGWKFIAIVSNQAQGTDAIDLLRTCAALRFSDRVLTAAEFAALYDAEKSQYGL